MLRRVQADLVRRRRRGDLRVVAQTRLPAPIRTAGRGCRTRRQSENEALGCASQISRSTVTRSSWPARSITTAGTGSAVWKRNSQPTRIRTSPVRPGTGDTSFTTTLSSHPCSSSPRLRGDKSPARGSRSRGKRSTASRRTRSVARHVYRQHRRAARPDLFTIRRAAAMSIGPGPKKTALPLATPHLPVAVDKSATGRDSSWRRARRGLFPSVPPRSWPASWPARRDRSRPARCRSDSVQAHAGRVLDERNELLRVSSKTAAHARRTPPPAGSRAPASRSCTPPRRRGSSAADRQRPRTRT